jgi:hypothetical protein
MLTRIRTYKENNFLEVEPPNFMVDIDVGINLQFKEGREVERRMNCRRAVI